MGNKGVQMITMQLTPSISEAAEYYEAIKKIKAMAWTAYCKDPTPENHDAHQSTINACNYEATRLSNAVLKELEKKCSTPPTDGQQLDADATDARCSLRGSEAETPGVHMINARCLRISRR